MDKLQSRTVTTGEDGSVKELSTFVGPGQESSVEIRQTAKGDAQVTVKVYDLDPEMAMRQAVDLYKNTLSLLGAQRG